MTSKIFESSKAFLTAIIGTILLTQNLVWAGGRDSGGGSGVAFYKTDRANSEIQVLEKVITTDVYRTFYEFPHSERIHFDSSILEQNVGADHREVEAQSEIILQELLVRLGRHAEILVQKMKAVENEVKNWTNIPTGQKLKLKDDFGPLLKFADAQVGPESKLEMKQIVLRRANQFLRDNELYQKMDAFNRASIKFHEMAYAAASQADSYRVQLLFGFVVSLEFKSFNRDEVKKLLEQKFSLQYQNSSLTSKNIVLPENLSIVFDREYSYSDRGHQAFDKLALTDSMYGDGGYFENQNASQKAVCGEIRDFDHQEKTIRYHSLTRNLNPFTAQNYSDEYETYSVPDEEWDKLFKARSVIDQYMNASYPDYLFPGMGFKIPFNACIITNAFGSLEHFDYLEITMGYSESEANTIAGQAAMTVNQIRYEAELNEINHKIKKLDEMENSISPVSEKNRQSLNKLNSELAKLIAGRNAIQISYRTQELAQSYSEIPSLHDYFVKRILGVKFRK